MPEDLFGLTADQVARIARAVRAHEEGGGQRGPRAAAQAPRQPTHAWIFITGEEAITLDGEPDWWEAKIQVREHDGTWIDFETCYLKEVSD